VERRRREREFFLERNLRDLKRGREREKLKIKKRERNT